MRQGAACRAVWSTGRKARLRWSHTSVCKHKTRTLSLAAWHLASHLGCYPVQPHAYSSGIRQGEMAARWGSGPAGSASGFFVYATPQLDFGVSKTTQPPLLVSPKKNQHVQVAVSWQMSMQAACPSPHGSPPTHHTLGFAQFGSSPPPHHPLRHYELLGCSPPALHSPIHRGLLPRPLHQVLCVHLHCPPMPAGWPVCYAPAHMCRPPKRLGCLWRLP